MIQVKLKKVWVGMKETKFGEKEQVAIQTTTHGDKYLSTFKVTPEMKTWKVDDVVEINVTQKGEYLNFDTGAPSENSIILERLDKLEKAVFGSHLSKPAMPQRDLAEPVVQLNDASDFDF